MKKSLLGFVAVIAMIFTGCHNQPSPVHVEDIKSLYITYDEAKKIHKEGKALFIDARPYKLYSKGTIAGSLMVPAKKYGKKKHMLPGDRSALIVTYCNGFKCEKSDIVAEKLLKDGYSNVKIYKGGYPEWKEKKGPLMGLVKECKGVKSGKYTPKGPIKKVKGAKLYTVDDEPNQVDQFWFTPMINKPPKNVQVVDIRPAEDFKKFHFKGAINIPFNMKKGTMNLKKLPKNKAVVFHCHTGMMSIDAVNYAKKKGYKNVFFLDANVECKKGNCNITPNELD